VGAIYEWSDLCQQAVQLLEQAMGQEGEGRGAEGGLHRLHCECSVEAIPSNGDKLITTVVASGLEAELLYPFRPKPGYFAIDPSATQASRSSEERRRSRSDSYEGYHPVIW
jgi:hypothetical protein